MKTWYVRAELRDLRVSSGRLIPTLQIEVAFSFGKASGYNLSVPDEVKSLTIAHVQGSLFWQGEDGDKWPDEGKFIGFGFPSPRQQGRPLEESGDPVRYTLWFPLTPSEVSRIEELRGGSKARFHLDLNVGGFYRRPINVFNPPASTLEDKGHPVDTHTLKASVLASDVAEPFQIDRLTLSTADGTVQKITIEKSKWSEEILGSLGHGRWKLYEVPLTEGPELAEVDRYIAGAHGNFLTGDWKDCVGRSRDAIQALEPYLKRWINPVYSDKKGGQAEQKAADLVGSFTELARSMFDFQAKVFSILSAGAHPEGVGATVERGDAELALSLAMTCRRYVGLRMLQATP